MLIFPDMEDLHDVPQSNPEDNSLTAKKLRLATWKNYEDFLRGRGIVETQFLTEYGIDVTFLKASAKESILKRHNVSDPQVLTPEARREYASSQDNHKYIMFYMDLFEKTATDLRPVSKRTPSFPVLYSLVHLLPETGQEYDSTGNKNILGEDSYAMGALMAVTAGDPDLPIEETRNVAVVQVPDGLPNGGWAFSEALIRKEYIIEALVNYMMLGRKIGLHEDTREWDYAAAGNAVRELVQRYRDELDTLPEREAKAWRRYKYIFNPSFDEDLRRYVDVHQQSQTVWKAREATEAERVQAVTLTNAHFARFAKMLKIKGELPERYKTFLEKSLANMKERPNVHGYDLETIETDPDDFLIRLVFHAVIPGSGYRDEFVTRQWPIDRQKVIRLTFGGKHHTDVVGKVDPETNRYKNRLA